MRLRVRKAKYNGVDCLEVSNVTPWRHEQWEYVVFKSEEDAITVGMDEKYVFFENGIGHFCRVSSFEDISYKQLQQTALSFCHPPVTTTIPNQNKLSQTKIKTLKVKSPEICDFS